MHIKHFTDIDCQTWDNFIKSCRGGHSYFSYAMTALPPPRTKPGNYENASFGIVDDNGELLLIFQLFIQYRKRTLKDYIKRRKQSVSLGSFHGLCVKDNLYTKQYKQLKKCFETYIDSFWQSYRCGTLAVSMPAFTDITRPENITHVNPLIYWNFAPMLGYTYIIDLHNPIDVIMEQYAQTTRNLINRIKNNNEYSIYESDGDALDFISLKKLNAACYEHQDTTKQLTDEYLLHLWDIIKEKQYCRCFFLKHGSENICYIILLYSNDCVYYFWGAGTHESQNAQRYFMHSLIEQCKAQGYKWFDVGAANTWLRHGKDKTISDYKKSFSNVIHPIYKGIYII